MSKVRAIIRVDPWFNFMIKGTCEFTLFVRVTGAETLQQHNNEDQHPAEVGEMVALLEGPSEQGKDHPCTEKCVVAVAVTFCNSL